MSWHKMEVGEFSSNLRIMKHIDATREALRKLRTWKHTGQLSEERFKRLEMVLENRMARCYAKSA
ncbi:MAG: hypothetical protein ACO36I_11575 [Candidatus Latescibacterota bacterium]